MKEGGMVMVKEKEKDGKVVVSIWVDKKIVNDLDYIAEKGGITRSKLISNLLEMAAHDMMIVDKFGGLRMAAFFWDMRDALRNAGTKFKDKLIMGSVIKKD
jgi:hypothetical protein